MIFKDNLKDFNTPMALPKNNTQSQEWQDANLSWWERHPMRYDWNKSLPFKEFTKDFYLEIDKRFFIESQKYMPWQKIPFDSLIDFDGLIDKDVLEIGVGSGSHAQLLASFSKSYVGIDLTNYAVKTTSKRMKCFQLDGKIFRMDAEEMQFDSDSFDFIWTWGVIHHTSNTKRALKEMQRVLRPGGKAIIMVYHRNFWDYYIVGFVFHGFIQGDLFKTKSLHKTIQNFTDGAIARYYTIREWRTLVSEFFSVQEIKTYGNKATLFPLPAGKLKKTLMSLFPNRVSRFLTNSCGLGRFLVSIVEKR